MSPNADIPAPQGAAARHGTLPGLGRARPGARPSLRAGLLAALLAVTAAAGAWATYDAVHGRLVGELAQRSRTALDLYVSGLRGTFSKFRVLPRIFAEHPATKALFAPDGTAVPTPPVRHRANALFGRMADAVGASAIYLMAADGTTLAASNWDTDVSFVGKNYAYRPYFRMAMQGRPGRFFAVGATSGKRGYFFAAPVRKNGRIVGAAVVKLGVAAIERRWGDGDHVVLVTDPANVTFMASRPDWRYRRIGPASEAAMTDLRRTRRYAGRELGARPVVDAGPSVAEGARRVRVAGTDGADPDTYLRLDRRMPEADWGVTVLAQMGSAQRQALIITGALWLAAAGLAATIWVLTLRRRALREKLEAEEAARAALKQSADELERRVEARTAELRRTQDELVQAAKLAALGRLLAGLGHEINQPLTAIRGYAQNAVAFLERGAHDTARDNMRAVGELTERAGRIIAHLKSFARKSDAEHAPIALADAVAGARQIVDAEARRAGVDLAVTVPDSGLYVVGDAVRLEQVLVNVLGNAVDAVRERDDRRVRLFVHDSGPRVAVVIEDSGPGVPREVRERVFEPFFTTKQVGEGLGLGLSISHDIVADMGGHLALGRSEWGGARFTVTLPRAEDDAPPPAGRGAPGADD